MNLSSDYVKYIYMHVLVSYVSFRQVQSGWPLHWWTASVKPWWECGGPTPPWMSLTRQTVPQKRRTVSANFAPRLHSTLCECRCASGCHCVLSRPTPYRRTPPGRTPRSSPNPAQSAKWPAALATPSLKCVRWAELTHLLSNGAVLWHYCFTHIVFPRPLCTETATEQGVCTRGVFGRDSRSHTWLGRSLCVHHPHP